MSRLLIFVVSGIFFFLVTKVVYADQNQVQYHYNPNAQFQLDTYEEVYRFNVKNRPLKVLIYQPQGSGPFPVLISLHGGAWNFGDRKSEEGMNKTLASSGILVLAIDLTTAPESPYPANIQDANFAIDWAKRNAQRFKGNPSKLGLFGGSSGGHIAQLLALRPNYYTYKKTLEEQNTVNPKADYVIVRGPISNPYTRFMNAQEKGNLDVVNYTNKYFFPWETIYEGNPHELLLNKQFENLPPMLIINGALDNNTLPEMQIEFAQNYKKLGGFCDLIFFPNSEHRWTGQESPETTRARNIVKEFIAKQLN